MFFLDDAIRVAALSGYVEGWVSDHKTSRRLDRFCMHE